MAEEASVLVPILGKVLPGGVKAGRAMLSGRASLPMLVKKNDQ